jgi:hypothetical protein
LPSESMFRNYAMHVVFFAEVSVGTPLFMCCLESKNTNDKGATIYNKTVRGTKQKTM